MSAAPAPAAAEPELRAQAIDCGGLCVAVPFDWARSVVERFDLSPAPNAPPWLAGAANVEGRILPVVDLAAWVDPAAAQAADPSQRLLVGGEAESAFAFLFRGLPQPARWTAGSPAAAPAEALAPFILGRASLAGPHPGSGHAVIDARRLGLAWVAELSY